MSDAVDDFLTHHGVKGMHWGRRKETSSVSHPQRTYTARIPGTKTQVSYTPPGVKGQVAIGVSLLAAGSILVAGELGSRALLKTSSIPPSTIRSGAFYANRILGDMGKSLPYAKMIQGVAQVTTLAK